MQMRGGRQSISPRHLLESLFKVFDDSSDLLIVCGARTAFTPAVVHYNETP